MRLLDTNIISTYLKNDATSRYPSLVARVDEILSEEGLTIAAVSLYEIRRGLLQLESRGDGRRVRVRTEKLLRSAYVLGLDAPAFAGWDHAAELWAAGRRASPAITFTEGDLLIAATARTHERTLVTCEGRLRDALIGAGFMGEIEVITLR